MWYIESKKHPDKKVFFVTDEEYVVGRKDSKILVENDASLSRKHAQLSLSAPENGQSKFAALTIKDLDSKYGTCVSGKKLVPNQIITLKNNDIISFGKLDCIWRVIHKPLVVVTSCIPNSDKVKLKKLVSKLGGYIASEYISSCSYLVMNSIMVTVKTVCALASMKHIVLPSFFSDMVERFTNNESPSDPNIFLPPVGEDALKDINVCFAPDENRPKLLKDKKFIFFDVHQASRLSLGLSLAGGDSETTSLDNLSNLDTLIEPGICVMRSFTGSSTQSSFNVSQNPNLNKVKTFLKRKNKRWVSESEIGLAIVHSSVEKYCNADYFSDMFNSGKNVRLQSQSLSQQYVLAPDSLKSDLLNDSPMKQRKDTQDDNYNYTDLEELSKKESEATKNVKELKEKRQLKPPFDISTDEIANINHEDGCSKHESDIGTCIGTSENKRSKRAHPEECPVMSVNKKKRTELEDFVIKKEVCTEDESSNGSSNFVNVAHCDKKHSKMLPEKAKKNYQNEDLPGFLSTVNKTEDRMVNTITDNEDYIPNNVLKIKYVDLIDNEKLTRQSDISIRVNYQGKNFKKYKKKHNVTSYSYTELIAYVQKSDKIQDLDDWCNENGIESQKDNYASDVEDKFDWDAPLKPKKKPVKRKF